MLYDEILHDDLLVENLPAPVVLDTGVWRKWTTGETLGGFLQEVSDIGTGTIKEPYDTVTDVPESKMIFEFEFIPDDIGDYPFTAVPALQYVGDVVSANLAITGVGIWNDRIIEAVPESLDFEQIGSVEDTVKSVVLSALNRKALLDSSEGVVSDPAFEIVPSGIARLLQPSIIPEGGAQYYLHTDGSITTNPNGALAPIAYGAGGKWKMGTAP